MDKHLRRQVQPGLLASERVEQKSILETLNPLTNVRKHKGVSAAGVLFLSKDTGRCLFQLRNSDKRHKNSWGFWGGMMEEYMEKEKKRNRLYKYKRKYHLPQSKPTKSLQMD